MFSRADALDSLTEQFAFIWADMDTGEILYASRPAEKMFGYEMHGELRGKTVEVLIPEAVRLKHVEHRQRYAERPGVVRAVGKGAPVYGQHRDGKVIPLHVGLGAEVMNGRKVVIANILEREEVKPAPEAAHEMAAQLIQMAEKVKEIGDKKEPAVATPPPVPVPVQSPPPPLPDTPKSEAKP